jgi:hypothetical protein
MTWRVLLSLFKQSQAMISHALYLQSNSSCCVTLVCDTVGFGAISLLQRGNCDEARFNDGMRTGEQVFCTLCPPPHSTCVTLQHSPLSRLANPFALIPPSPNPLPIALSFVYLCVRRAELLLGLCA